MHIMEYHSAPRKKETLTSAAPWLDLEHVTPGE